MFGSTVIDVAIGMIFVYLLLSLLSSAISEYIELRLKNRSKDLWRGIQLLLNGQINKKRPNLDTASPPGEVDLASELYQHGLVRALFRDQQNLPSYIPSRTFALALWSLASRKAAEASGPSDSPPDAAIFATTDLKKIRVVIDQFSVYNPELAQALGTLIDDARGDFNKAVKNVEDWYDGAMDRVSGWYKQRVQKHLIVIGCVTALLINADSVNIAKSLIQDKALRDVVVAEATAYAEERNEAGKAAGGTKAGNAADGANAGKAGTNADNTNAAGTNTNNTNNAGTNTNTTGANTNDTGTNTNNAGTNTNNAGTNSNANDGAGKGGAATPTPAPSPAASPSPTPDPKARVDELRKDLYDLGLPIGWNFAASYKDDPMRGTPHLVRPDQWKKGDFLNVGGWLILKIFGLFLTGLAISQGAPFWFDLLNKFMVIRSTVKPKEKSQTQQSKDNTEDENEANAKARNKR